MIKIDDINSLEDILQLNKLNINIISVIFEKNNIDKLFAIKNILRKDILLCIQFDNISIDKENDFFLILDAIKPNYIQFQSNEFLPLSTIIKIKEKNINIIYTSNLDCDEDIMWVFPSFSIDLNNDVNKIQSIFLKYNIHLQINIMPNHKDSWKMLETECGEYEEDLTINEIKNFISKYNTFLTINYNQTNIDKIIGIFSENIGNTLSLLEYNFSELKNILGCPVPLSQ